MKNLKYIFSTLLFLSLTISTFAQMESVSWRNVPSPALAGEGVFLRRAEINQMSNGEWYSSYIDDFGGMMYIKSFDTETQNWNLLHQFEFISGNPMELDTYVANDKLYVGVTTDDLNGDNFNLWEINASGDVTQLMSNVNSSVSSFSKMDFVVVGDELFMASTNSGLLNVDSYNLTSQSYVSTSPLTAVPDVSLPNIVVDHSDNSLVVGGADANNFYFIYKASIQVTLNFLPMNGNGFINSAIIGANPDGSWIKLIEKESNSPEAMFMHDNGVTTNMYRVGLYNNTVVEMQFTNPDLLSGPAVAQFGNSTYVGGFNNLAGGAELWEVSSNGNKVAVAADNNPAFLQNTADGLITAFSDQVGTGRVAVYYHVGTGNGTGPGNFQFTNNRPSISNIDVESGCLGSYKYALKNIQFTDVDGDYVKIVNGSFSSSNPTIVPVGSISVNENSQNVWAIELQGDALGTSDISFQYTDGFDTLTANYNVEIVEPTAINFVAADIELCINQNEVDLNQFVNVTGTGGRFTIANYTIPAGEGLISLDSLNILTFPFTDDILYEYEDANGCFSTALKPVTIFDNPSSTLNVTNSQCGVNNGEIIATINSPNGNYSQYWNTGDQGVSNLTGLSPGTYYHNIVDEVGCVSVSQADLQSSDITLSANLNNPTCFGANNGSIELSINGANGPYDVLWSSGHSATTIQNLTAGNYVAIVSNANGCSVSQSFDLTQPSPIEMEYTRINPTCGQSDGGVQQVMIQGGNGGYLYQWSSGGGTAPSMSGVPAGNYGLQVADAEGCQVTKSYQLNPLEGALVSGDVSKSICGTNSGSIEIDVFPELNESVTSIEWTNGATSEDIYNLAPGVYTCEIEQSNGCTADYTWTVEAVKAPRPEICIVTVDTSTTTNLIVWEKPSSNAFNIDHYRIYRETSTAGQFQLIDTVQYSSISVFNDVVASPLNRSWRYRISAVTSCGQESALSNPHKTIHLVMNDLGNGDFDIIWDNYEGFPYATYDLLRYTDQDGQWLPVQTAIPVNALPNTVDTPTSLPGLDYMIRVTPPGGTCVATENKAQDYNSSRSNKPRSDFNPGDGTGDPNNSLITNESEDYTVAMYPNPADGRFEIALYHEKPKVEMDIQIVNIQGQTVYQSKIINGVNYIDLGSVESGVYFVNVEDGNTSERMKIVIK